MSEPKLRLCPFCGGEGEVITDEFAFAVMCKQCHAMTAFYLDDTKRAIRAWNTRWKPTPKERIAEYLAQPLTR